MSPWFFAIMSNFRRQVTQTFTANATWVAPFTTSNIDTASGKGQDGTPGTPDSYGPPPQQKIYQHFFKRRDGGPDDTTTEVGPAPTSEWPTGAPRPAGGSTTTPTPESTVYYEDVFIWSYAYGDPPLIPGTPPTTGPSASAFGKVFAGGYGGPATTTTFNNIAVTPNGSYNIVIPSGGSLTITYWQ